jgi:hypothetical protein
MMHIMVMPCSMFLIESKSSLVNMQMWRWYRGGGGQYLLEKHIPFISSTGYALKIVCYRWKILQYSDFRLFKIRQNRVIDAGALSQLG